MKIVILLFYLPFSLGDRVWYAHNFKIPPRTKAPGPKSTGKPGATTRALFYFEGVDYDLMPENLKEKNKDCHGHFVWCIQNQTFMNPVCAWSHYYRYLYDFNHPCEIELENCRHRKQMKLPFKGDDMRNDELYYNGEGYDCKYYARMGGDPVENYFRMGSRRADFDYKKPFFDNLAYKVMI